MVPPACVTLSINIIISLQDTFESSPPVVKSVVLHSLVGKIPKLVVRCGHMCLIALNYSVLVLHLTAHCLQIHDINLRRPSRCVKQRTGMRRKKFQAHMHDVNHMLNDDAVAALTSPILCRSFRASLMTSRCLSCSFVSRRTSSRSCSAQQMTGR